jgi:hypothetical protein
MSTLLLTDRSNPQCVIPAHGRLLTRLWVHLHTARLDRALAGGACPDSSAALSLRASVLIGAAARRDLARGIQRLIEDARCVSRGPLRPGAPLCRAKILDSAVTLREIEERLVSHDPLDVRGVAMLTLLLTDGAGPIYYRPSAQDLQMRLDAIVAALEPSLERC